MPPAALDLLRAEIAAAWAPRERISLSAWCARELRLPAETGPSAGPLDFAAYPFAPGIIDAADDPDVEQIVIVGGTQWGKTTILLSMLASLAVLRPAPAILVAPDKIELRKIRNRFYAMALETPALAPRIPPRHRWNLSEIDFGSSLCHLAYTGNPQRVSGLSCRVVLLTETDRSHHAMREGALHKLVQERVKAWHNFLIVFEGTPTDDDSVIAAKFEASNQQRFLVPCPRCGHFQPLRFFPHKEGPYAGCGGVLGLKNGDGDWLTPDQARGAAYYVCEKGCRIEQHEKPGMVSRGVWCPKGCDVQPDGTLSGEPLRSRRICGFGDLNSLYAPAITVGRMAAEYLSSRDKPEEYRSFHNNWLGLKYTPQVKTPKSLDLHRRLAGGHPRRGVPPGAIFLTAGADVHDDDTHWVVRAWGEGCTSWLVDWGICPVLTDDRGNPILGSQLAPLEGLLLSRTWPLISANPLGQMELPIVKLGIDCGWVPLAVHDWARHFDGDRVLTVAGDTHPVAGQPWTFSIVERNLRTGKAYPGGLKRWALNTDYYKQDLHDRWAAPLGEPGAWFLTAATYDEAKPYLDELVNEGAVISHNKAGFPVRKWIILRKGMGNHYLDCEGIARALADMVVGGVWESLVARFQAAADTQRATQRSEETGGHGFIRRPGGRFGRR